MDAAAKQQVVERVKQANNILVTVSSDPSVDQLAACIGLTLLFNKMGKHATAIFSGKVPSTIEFLQPEKTIETNTDSLQDFIISLDKEKADKLRYKVEDQVVKIFITPYKTSLSERDLVFSKGDFNVEAVIALGIVDKTQIDAAITAHGRILHDATVVALGAGQDKAAIGQINWQDPAASSLCEMIVSISEAFGGGLIDNQMATAFLTGIVAETDRFSNAKTTPKVMTMSAQLMAAGANQQLIASKLEQEVEAPIKRPVAKKPIAEQKLTPAGDPEAELEDGTLSIDHNDKKPGSAVDPEEIHIDEHGNIKTAADLAPPPPPEAALQEELSESVPQPAAPAPAPASPPAEPSAPGPHALLSTEAPALTSPFSATTETEWKDPYNSVSIDPLNNAAPAPSAFEQKAQDVPLPDAQAKAEPAQTVKPAQQAATVDNARDAVASALSQAPFDPAFDPIASLNATPVDIDKPGEGQPQLQAQPDQPPEADKTAPPPFPPPLEPTAGAVIPNTPTNGNNA